jgi:hypothetical protein
MISGLAIRIVLIGLSLLLCTSDLQSEFVSISHTVSRPLLALTCRTPAAGIALKTI